MINDTEYKTCVSSLFPQLDLNFSLEWQNYCQSIQGINHIFFHFFTTLLYILGLSIIAITFSGLVKEDYRFIILNSVLFYLAESTFRIFNSLFPSFSSVLDNSAVHFFFISIVTDYSSVTSVLLSAHRFVIIFFDVYTNKRVLLWTICIFDTFIISLYAVTAVFQNNLQNKTFIFVDLCVYVVFTGLHMLFTIAIFAKIYVAMKSTEKSSPLYKTYQDAKKMAIYCMFQGLVSCTLPIINTGMVILLTATLFDSTALSNYMLLHIIYFSSFDNILLCFLNLEMFTALILLKHYRQTAIKVLEWVVKKSKINGNNDDVSKSFNNLTKTTNLWATRIDSPMTLKKKKKNGFRSTSV